MSAVGGPRLSLVVAAMVGLALPASPTTATAAAAQGPLIVEFPVPGTNPNGIATGADGNLWFTDPTNNSVDRFSSNGTVTAYPVLGTNVIPNQITSGPDGNLWFLEMNGQGYPPITYIGKMTTAGVASQYPTQADFMSGLAAGPDGNVWFNERDMFSVAKITPAGAVTSYLVPGPPAGEDPIGIVAGPDGNMWVTDESSNIVWKVTTGGTFTPFNLPTPNRGAAAITVGADGNLWFFEGNVNKIGRMTTNGTLTEFSIPTSNARVAGLAPGADGNVWFTEVTPNQIGVISRAGVIQEYPIPTASSNPRGPTLGPDGHIWFPEYAGNIARVTGPGRSAGAVPPVIGHPFTVHPRSTPPPIGQSSASTTAQARSQATASQSAPPVTRLISARLLDAILQRLRAFF